MFDYCVSLHCLPLKAHYWHISLHFHFLVRLTDNLKKLSRYLQYRILCRIWCIIRDVIWPDGIFLKYSWDIRPTLLFAEPNVLFYSRWLLDGFLKDRGGIVERTRPTGVSHPHPTRLSGDGHNVENGFGSFWPWNMPWVLDIIELRSSYEDMTYNQRHLVFSCL